MGLNQEQKQAVQQVILRSRSQACMLTQVHILPRLASLRQSNSLKVAFSVIGSHF